MISWYDKPKGLYERHIRRGAPDDATCLTYENMRAAIRQMSLWTGPYPFLGEIVHTPFDIPVGGAYLANHLAPDHNAKFCYDAVRQRPLEQGNRFPWDE